MVLDPDDPDTYSAGSFFTNPILDAAQAAKADTSIRAKLGQDVSYPCYPVRGSESVKLSAAWLIERAGFAKGYPGPGGRVAVSSKHTLALTNRGGSTADLVALAREIRDGVRECFGVRLNPEPLLIGVSLDD
jgi:UDP-N-acetylmuramate dehydrogenase